MAGQARTMIVPDVNLLIHAYDLDSPYGSKAQDWLRTSLGGTRPVGWAWITLLAFIRIMTHRKIVARPLSPEVACQHVRDWLSQPYAMILEPSPRHAKILFGLLEHVGTAGNLTTDAHLAALAIDHQAELHSTDADFSRFPGLKWHDPLRSS